MNIKYQKKYYRSLQLTIVFVSIFLFGCNPKNYYLVNDIKSNCSLFYHFIFVEDNKGKRYIIISNKSKNIIGTKISKGGYYSFLLHKMTDSILQKNPLYQGITDDGDSLLLVTTSHYNYIPCDTLKIGPMQSDLFFASNLKDLYLEK